MQIYVYANLISIYICRVQLNIHNIDIKVSQSVSQSVSNIFVIKLFGCVRHPLL